MLVLARKQGQGVWIGGTLVRVEIRGAIVKLAIDAPAEVRVWRRSWSKIRRKRSSPNCRGWAAAAAWSPAGDHGLTPSACGGLFQ